MDNPYITYAPQMMANQPTDLSYQNIQGQSGLHNQLMQQQQQFMQPAQQQQSMNPMALAKALRGMGADANGGVSAWDNAQAWLNSKLNRDESVM
jgi:hypothetical protein